MSRKKPLLSNASPGRRYAKAVGRRMRSMLSQWAYLRSPKPLMHMPQAYVTVFFDYEGRWVRDDQAENSQRGITAILDMLRSAKVRATFNVVANLAVEEAATVRRIIADGHEIASHTVAHTPIVHHSSDEMCQDIMRFREMIRDVGVEVLGFRAPQSYWSFKALSGLLKAGVLWDAESDGSPCPYVIRSSGDRRLWRMPVCRDDWEYEALGTEPAEMCRNWKQAVECAVRKRHYVAIGAHPWVVGKTNDRIAALWDYLTFLVNLRDVTIAPFGEVAAICETAVLSYGRSSDAG